MGKQEQLRVAVLLATYNGHLYVEQQIRSLMNNDIKFTLHWLDDHSTDNTREVVRSVAHSTGIELREWHQEQHLGLPLSFFQLLECVEADVYLFCDQDDIWQPGKISASVADLIPDLGIPALCFTDPLLFREDLPDRHYRCLDVLGVRTDLAMQESRIFMPVTAYGLTQGFTRPLRELYMRHKEIAREYAVLHDVWMYQIAVASGTARLVVGAPTALFRRHGGNSSEQFGNWGSGEIPRYTTTWRQHQHLRRILARNARGFILASATLGQGPKLNRFRAIAGLVATIDKQQSPRQLLRLVNHGAIWASRRLALETAAVCLCSSATP